MNMFESAHTARKEGKINDRHGAKIRRESKRVDVEVIDVDVLLEEDEEATELRAVKELSTALREKNKKRTSKASRWRPGWRMRRPQGMRAGGGTRN